MTKVSTDLALLRSKFCSSTMIPQSVKDIICGTSTSVYVGSRIVTPNSSISAPSGNASLTSCPTCAGAGLKYVPGVATPNGPGAPRLTYAAPVGSSDYTNLTDLFSQNFSNAFSNNGSLDLNFGGLLSSITKGATKIYGAMSDLADCLECYAEAEAQYLLAEAKTALLAQYDNMLQQIWFALTNGSITAVQANKLPGWNDPAQYGNGTIAGAIANASMVTNQQRSQTLYVVAGTVGTFITSKLDLLNRLNWSTCGMGLNFGIEPSRPVVPGNSSLWGNTGYNAWLYHSFIQAMYQPNGIFTTDPIVYAAKLGITASVQTIVNKLMTAVP